MIHRILGVMVLGVLGQFCTAARADSLDSATQQQIVAATFEVVQMKPPEDGPVTYERVLPMDLIPYQQRVDKYRSIGTAFAIGPNQYVTAGHVLSVGEGSQFGPPALRDGAGNVYEIDKVLKYSDDQDFVEFSLKHPPSSEKTLATAAPPALNDPVFAVGNALGQGVVVRDGVFTSETPEEINGRWKWLRFTAAASPGNSGGPLVDKKGNVIGIVLRKSESENLNYAAPISLVTAASKSEGTIDSRANYRLPMMDASEMIESHEQVPLPSSLADFYANLQKVVVAIMDRSTQQLLDHNKTRLFPNSQTSATLLSEVLRSPFPRLIHEAQDRNWAIASPQLQSAQLENNGFVRSGGFLHRVRVPDDLKLANLYGDSKLYMDLMLRAGFNLKRTVGTASIKVTSLGKAVQESAYTDTWGRNWQIKIYAIPFDDIYLVTMNLPTPEGYAAMFLPARGAAKDVTLAEEKLLANYIYVTFEGTLAKWREFLPLKADQPKIFGSLNVKIDGDYSKLSFSSRRIELNVTPEVLPLSATTVLALDFSYFKDGGTVVWDLGSILVGEGAQKNEYVDARRFDQPDPSLPDKIQSTWKKVEANEYPFNGVAADDNGGMRASTAVGNGAGSAARYALTVRNEGAPGQDAMHTRLDALQKAFKDLEH
ncbi:MAG TPA: serine protease [Steroidobacteraceae bacterium]|nr:serine protease [Steroidobacteraceae bacterium]